MSWKAVEGSDVVDDLAGQDLYELRPATRRARQGASSDDPAVAPADQLLLTYDQHRLAAPNCWSTGAVAFVVGGADGRWRTGKLFLAID